MEEEDIFTFRKGSGVARESGNEEEEQELKEKMDQIKEEVGENSEIQPLTKHIARMMYAAGDCKTPLKESVSFLHSFVEEVLKAIYSEEILVGVLKWQNPVISKKVKFKKLLCYLERVFPVETTVYFSSIEIKVSSLESEVRNTSA
jgi:precorrin isomerase